MPAYPVVETKSLLRKLCPVGGKNLINVSGTTSFNIDEVYVPTWEVIDAVFLK